MIQTISRSIASFVRGIGGFASWVNILLPFIILIDVLFRYLFNISFPWLFELEWHLFGLIFLLGAAQTYLLDKHVRVDLFYNKWGGKRRKWIDILGIVLFLLPFCIVGFIYSLKYTLNSFEILEGSPDPGGLPLRFLIKSCIPLMFLLLFFQGLNKLLNLSQQDD